MSWLKNIWKDPVWSSVIASSIIGLFVLLLEKYSSLAFLECIPNWGWCVVFIVFVLLILFGIYKKINSFEYDEYNFLREKETFAKIITDLLPHYSIDFMKNQNFRGSFRSDNIKVFFNFRDVKCDPLYSLVNPRLEGIKNNLFDNIIALVDNISKYSTPNKYGVILLEDYITENNDKMKEIHGYADNICKYYDQLVKEGYKLGL